METHTYIYVYIYKYIHLYLITKSCRRRDPTAKYIAQTGSVHRKYYVISLLGVFVLLVSHPASLCGPHRLKCLRVLSVHRALLFVSECVRVMIWSSASSLYTLYTLVNPSLHPAFSKMCFSPSILTCLRLQAGDQLHHLWPFWDNRHS